MSAHDRVTIRVLAACKLARFESSSQTSALVLPGFESVAEMLKEQPNELSTMAADATTARVRTLFEGDKTLQVAMLLDPRTALDQLDSKCPHSVENMKALTKLIRIALEVKATEMDSAGSQATDGSEAAHEEEDTSTLDDREARMQGLFHRRHETKAGSVGKVEASTQKQTASLISIFQAELQAEETPLKDLKPVPWWWDRRKKLGVLADLGVMYTFAPASTSCVEREFSIAGRTVRAHRARLHPDMVSALVKLNSDKATS